MKADDDFDPSETYTQTNPLTIRPEHIKLLREMCVRWDTTEYGAPAIDPKRPYGDSYVNDSIREITGMEEANDEWCRKKHLEMKGVLQVWLRYGALSPGDKICYTDYKWKPFEEVDNE